MFPGPEAPPPWDAFGAAVDLAAAFGAAHHDDDDGGSDLDAAAVDDAHLHGAVELPTLDVASSRVVRECAPVATSGGRTSGGRTSGP